MESNTKNSNILAQILKSEFSGSNRIQENDVVEVELIKKTPRGAFFDLGKFGTGVVYGVQLQNAKDILKSLNPGDRVAARVERMEGFMGYTELSLSEAGKQKVWQQIKELEEKGEILQVKVTGANQGGLMVDVLGLKGFLPISQLAPDNIPKSFETDRLKATEEMKEMISKELSVKIINVNPRSNKLIVSERESSSGQNIKELLANYEAGQIVDGVVSGVADFGIFIRFADNPEIEGLVHISEIDHRLIDNPKEIVKLNEPVKVKIIDIREGRVFLSLKALKQDPWENIADKVKEGQITEGTVYKFTGFGAIVDLDGGLQGMIHVSEFGGLDEMKQTLKTGEKYSFVVSALKPDEKRIVLKLNK